MGGTAAGAAEGSRDVSVLCLSSHNHCSNTGQGHGRAPQPQKLCLIPTMCWLVAAKCRISLEGRGRLEVSL